MNAIDKLRAANARIAELEGELERKREQAEWLRAELDSTALRLKTVERFLDAALSERDRREKQIEAVYETLGGEGEWMLRMPPVPPPDSGDLGEDAKALAASIVARAERMAAALQSVADRCAPLESFAGSAGSHNWLQGTVVEVGNLALRATADGAITDTDGKAREANETRD